jgi:hypothetical protein
MSTRRIQKTTGRRVKRSSRTVQRTSDGRWRIARTAAKTTVARPVGAVPSISAEQLEDALDLAEARRRVADADPDDWVPWDETDAGR